MTTNKLHNNYYQMKHVTVESTETALAFIYKTTCAFQLHFAL